MSDYISKSALIDSILQNVVITTEEGLDLRNEIFELIKNQPTVDEKEIIRKPFERVVERLEEKQNEFRQARHKLSLAMYTDKKAYDKARILTQKELSMYEAIKIVKEECGISE